MVSGMNLLITGCGLNVSEPGVSDFIVDFARQVLAAFLL
jgi:hypothetical protein